MNQDSLAYAQAAFLSLTGQTFQELSFFLPKLLAAILVLIVGALLARLIKRVAIQVVTSFKLSKMVANTPVELFLKSADDSGKIEIIIGNFFYWVCMLIVLNTSVVILGLGPVSAIFGMMLAYLPHLFSALLILIIGVVLAGFAETFIKGVIRTPDRRMTRLAGKGVSYSIIVISVLAAVSELGIASEFILILFVGFVAAVSLGSGLALGLGGQSIIKKFLEDWYRRSQKK